MPKGPSQQLYCPTCRRTMRQEEFYRSNNLEKYPNGFLTECRQCLTRHVDNWDPETYKWILQEVDVPYVPDEWNILLTRYGQDPSKLTGVTILGRYLSKMRLTQYRNFRYSDSEALQQKKMEEKRAVLIHQGYDEEKIEEEMAYMAQRPTPPKPAAPEPAEEPNTDSSKPLELGEDYFIDDLTDEDRKYLSLKWGRSYKPSEWVQMEQLYQDMIAAFNIETPAHLDNLKLYCKTSLKAHQLIDLGDIEGYQKIARVNESLMKTGNWTAAQNNKEKGDFVDCIGQLVYLAEQEGFIPRYYVSEPQDKVDQTIADMNHYTEHLVREELGLGNLIENALRALQQTEEKEEDSDVTIEDYDSTEELSDQDFINFNDEVEAQQKQDAEIMAELMDGGE